MVEFYVHLAALVRARALAYFPVFRHPSNVFSKLRQSDVPQDELATVHEACRCSKVTCSKMNWLLFTQRAGAAK